MVQLLPRSISCLMVKNWSKRTMSNILLINVSTFRVNHHFVGRKKSQTLAQQRQWKRVLLALTLLTPQISTIAQIRLSNSKVKQIMTFLQKDSQALNGEANQVLAIMMGTNQRGPLEIITVTMIEWNSKLRVSLVAKRCRASNSDQSQNLSKSLLMNLFRQLWPKRFLTNISKTWRSCIKSQISSLSSMELNKLSSKSWNSSKDNLNQKWWLQRIINKKKFKFLSKILGRPQNCRKSHEPEKFHKKARGKRANKSFLNLNGQISPNLKSQNMLTHAPLWRKVRTLRQSPHKQVHQIFINKAKVHCKAVPVVKASRRHWTFKKRIWRLK